jgi:hypothetical protein
LTTTVPNPSSMPDRCGANTLRFPILYAFQYSTLSKRGPLLRERVPIAPPPMVPAQLLDSWSEMNVACHLDARHDGVCTGSDLEHHLVRDIAAVSTSSEVQTSRRRCRITDDLGRSPTWIIRTPTGHTSKRPQSISGAFCRSLISLQIWLRGTATITPHDFHR